MSNYEKNIEALKQTSTDEFISKIETAEKPFWADLIKSDNGDPNILIRGMNNQVKPAYEMDSPRKVPRNMIKEIDFYKETACIQIGTGAGHLLKQILIKKEKEHKVIVAEPCAWLIKCTLENYDVSEYLLNRTLIFAHPTKDELALLISYVDGMNVIQDWTVLFEGYIIARENEYKDMLSHAYDILNQIRCNTGTIMGAGSQIAENDVLNIPYIIKHRGVKELKDLYKEKPAVLISTGPSLKKNLYQLIENQDKVIIIAVAQSLRLLLAYGITPDFITTVDFGEVNITHFNGLMDSKVPLVCLNRTYAPILKRYKGPKFIVVSEQPGFENTASGLMQCKGGIQQGGSVSHLNLGLAEHLGCSPITLIGQDLGYEDADRSHTDGADSSGKIVIEDGLLKWRVDDPNSDTLNKEDHIMGFPQYVDGYFGKPILTNVGLASFITSFEAMAKDKDNLYNCTEGGVRIKGMTQITLRKYLNNFCEKKLNKNKTKKLYSYCRDWKKLIKTVIPLLEDEIEIMNDMITHCEQGLNEDTLMEDNFNDKRMLKEAMTSNEMHSKEAHECAKKIQLVTMSILKENREIYGRDLKVEGKQNHLLENEEHLLTRIKRNRLILEAAKKAGERLIPLYEETRDILTKYLETKDESLLIEDKDEPMDMDDCMSYFETGNWAWPLICSEPHIYQENWNGQIAIDIFNNAFSMKQKEIEKAKSVPDRQEEIEYNELVYQSREIGRLQQDYEKAKELIEKAIKIFPEKEPARWGLATVLHHTGEVEKSIEEYKRLTDDFPKILRYKFEYGNILVMNDVENGLKIIGEVIEESEEYDHILRMVGELYAKNEKYEQALIAYEEYLVKFPADIQIMERLGTVYEKLGQEKKAKEIQTRLKSMTI